MSNESELSVVLLCGGKGERLRPLTTTIPKPLVPIKDRPILSYLIDHIDDFGVDNYVVATGYKAEKMQKFFEDRYSKLNYQLVNSGDADILDRLRDCRKFIPGDCLVLYGDTLSDVDVDKLIDFHHGHPGQATVTLWPLKSQFGIMEVNDQGIVTQYLEKPQLDKWINIGFFYFSQNVLAWLDGFKSFEAFLAHLIERRELNGYKHRGVHITVNTQKELAEAEKNINLLRAPEKEIKKHG